MNVEVPAEISLDGLVQNVDDIGATHSHMMLETVLADVLHQLLQVVNLRDCDTAIHSVRIVGELTLAQIGLDGALWIVGRDAEEGKWAF